MTWNAMYSRIKTRLRHILKLFYWLHKRSTDNKKVRSGEISGGKSKQFLLWSSISQIVLYIYSPQGNSNDKSVMWYENS